MERLLEGHEDAHSRVKTATQYPINLVDLAELVGERYDSVSLLLDTGREVSGESRRFNSRAVKRQWGQQHALEIEFADDHLEELMDKAVRPALSEVSVGDTVRFELDDDSHDHDTAIDRGTVLGFEYGKAMVGTGFSDEPIPLARGEIVEVLDEEEE